MSRKMQFLESGKVAKIKHKNPITEAFKKQEGVLAEELAEQQIRTTTANLNEDQLFNYSYGTTEPEHNQTENALYQNWRDIYENQDWAYRNINVGALKRIGKTETLRRIISEMKELWPTRTTILIVPNMNYRRQYEDLYNNGILNRIITNQRDLRSVTNALIFADEVQNIEQLHPNANVEFIAGFYSFSSRTNSTGPR